MTASDTESVVGSTVRQLRHEQEMSLDDLHQKTGIASSYLSTVETGKTSASHRYCEEVGDVLGVSPDWLKILAGKVPDDVVENEPTEGQTERALFILRNQPERREQNDVR